MPDHAPCRHCGSRAVIRARGLCHACYRRPAVRIRYPTVRRVTRRITRPDPYGPEPTRPGSIVRVNPGPRRGGPSNADDGHAERMAAHIERVARECQEVLAKPLDGELTVVEAAAILGVSRTTVQNRIWAGTIPARQTVVGSRSYYVIRRADLANLLRDRAADMAPKEVAP